MSGYILSSDDVKQLKHSLLKWILLFIASTCLAFLLIDEEAIRLSHAQHQIRDNNDNSTTTGQSTLVVTSSKEVSSGVNLCCRQRPSETGTTTRWRDLRKSLQQPATAQWRRLPPPRACPLTTSGTTRQPTKGALRRLAVRDVTTSPSLHEHAMPTFDFVVTTNRPNKMNSYL